LEDKSGDQDPTERDGAECEKAPLDEGLVAASIIHVGLKPSNVGCYSQVGFDEIDKRLSEVVKQF